MSLHECRDRRTVRVDAVIDVPDDGADSVLRSDLGDELQQRNGVEPARHGHEPLTRLESQGLYGGGELLPCLGRGKARLGQALRLSGQVRVPARRPG